MIRGQVAILLTAVSLAGCAVSPKAFYADPTRPNDTELCRAVFDANADEKFRQDVSSELIRRGVNGEKCRDKINMQNGVLIAAAVIGTGTAVAMTCRDGCAGGGYSPYFASAGYGYAWDEFYDEYGQLIWRCRDKSNGEFADSWHCPGAQFDDTWPSKSRY